MIRLSTPKLSRRMENPSDRGDWTSASSAEADTLCAGRHRAQFGLTEPESAAATFGDEVHAAAAGESVDLTMRQEKVLELAEQRRAKVMARFPHNTFVVEKERRLWAEQRGWKHSGQADAIYYDQKAKLAVIEDLKSLRGLVADSPENMQLRDLAVLTWLNYSVDEVVVYINQPLAGDQQKITRYDPATLAQAWSYMKLRISNSNDPTARLVPGEIQCKYCRARGLCPESIAWTEAESQSLALRKQSAEELVARIPIETVAGVHRKAKTIMSILDAVKVRLLALDDAELGKVGLRKRAGFEIETINDNKALIDRLKVLKIKPKDSMLAMKMTKTNLEALVRKASGKKGRELDILMDETLLGIVDKKQTSDRLEIVK